MNLYRVKRKRKVELDVVRVQQIVIDQWGAATFLNHGLIIKQIQPGDWEYIKPVVETKGDL